VADFVEEEISDPSPTISEKAQRTSIDEICQQDKIAMEMETIGISSEKLMRELVASIEAGRVH